MHDNSVNHKTVSGYHTKYVFEKLTETLINNQLNPSLYWLSEILASNEIEKCWYFIFDFQSMYIHIYYPNFILYIYEKYQEYRNLKKLTRFIELRNNVSVREFFYRIIYVFSTINKRYIIYLFKKHSWVFVFLQKF